MGKNINDLRMDDAESAFFQRELEAIDARVYEVKYPQLKSRTLIPSAGGIPAWARVYTWRETDKVGAAKIISNMADDLPAVDVFSSENSKIIKYPGASYNYDIMEVKAAAAMGRPLDRARAMACRFAVELEVDTILATGSVLNNLQGLLNLAGITAFTPGTKTGGGTAWGTVQAPNATPDEIIGDILGIVADVVDTSKGMFSHLTVVLPVAQYTLAASMRLGDGSDTTVLDHVLKVGRAAGTLAGVESWHLCQEAGGTGIDRMVAYPKDEMVVAGIVPMEYTPMSPQQVNLAFKVNAFAACGGVVCRYPIALRYGDGI